MMSKNKCPPGNLQSFPVTAGFSVTNTTFTQAKQRPLNIRFNWGTRTTAPNFSYATSGIIDHIQNDSLTSLMYNETLYTLASVQLTGASHNNWLVPDNLEVSKIDNLEDIMITFQRDMYADLREEEPYFIILVNPIIRNSSQNGNPLYLANMANQIASPLTLETIFPYISTKTYAYYTTCVNGVTTQDPYKNILVLLNINGMIVSADLMIKIKSMYNKFSEGSYPTYVPPGNLSVHSNPNDSIKRIREGFQTASTYSPGAPNSLNRGSAPTSRYTVDKCVPFDPEMQMNNDGVILLNNNGQPMKNIIDARTVSKSAWTKTHVGVIPLSTVEETFIYTVVGLFGLFLLGLVVYFGFIRWNYTTDTQINSGQKIFSLITTLIFPLSVFIVGFFVGIFTMPANCNNNCPKENDPVHSSMFKGFASVIIVLLGIHLLFNIYFLFSGKLVE